MKCPTCKADVRVLDGVKVPGNKQYRLRACKKCGKQFYTVETIVDPIQEPDFAENWRAYHRRRLQKLGYSTNKF